MADMLAKSRDEEDLLTKVQMLIQRYNNLSSNTTESPNTAELRRIRGLTRDNNLKLEQSLSLKAAREKEKKNIEKEKDENEPYSYSHVGKGLVVIIANKKFKNHSARGTVQHDIRIFEEIFAKLLHFNIIILTDRDTDELKKDLSDISQNIEADVDCFICLISSHGGEQYMPDNHTRQHVILTHDGSVYTHEIIEAFSNCPKLKHKPKLFFIQTCSSADGAERENKYDHGINVEVEKKHCLMPLDSTEPIKTTDYVGSQSKGFCITSCFADCLVMYSSASGRVAFSRPGTGGWLPACLYQVMYRLVHTGFNTDLLQVLTEVNREMAYTKETKDGYKSTACIYHMLSRDLILSPKKSKILCNLNTLSVNN